MTKRTVFVSYSRKDGNQVEQAVELLEAGGTDVFRDIDDIQYGDRWEDVIRTQLAEAERVLVFWSLNAQLSEWVKREWMIAISMNKRVVPILLDTTPLPVELGQFHALSHFMLLPNPKITSSASNSPNASPQTQAKPPYVRWILLGVGGVAIASITLVSLNLQQPKTEVAQKQQQTLPTEADVSPPSMGVDTTIITSSGHLTTSEGPSGDSNSPKDNADVGADNTPSPPIAPSASIAAPPSKLSPETPLKESHSYLVWLAGFLVLFAIISYLIWQQRQSRRKQLQAAEQLIQAIFQE